MENTARKRTQGINATRRNLLFISIPFLLFIAAFSYVPLLGWSISFFKYYPGIPFSKLQFMGLKYFAAFFINGEQVLNILLNTFVLSGLIIITLPIPAIFAILLNELNSKYLKKVVQTVSTVPYFISFVLIYLTFVTILSPSDGMLNMMLMRMHIISKPLNVINNPTLAWGLQTFVYLFKNSGYGAILYLSAISGIDPQLFDAAEVDGAGRFRKIIHVIVPGITSTFVVLLVLGLGNLLSGGGFEQYYVFGNAIVLDKLDVIDTYTYRMGIVQSNYSFGVAMSMLKSILSLALLMAANFIVKRVRGSSIF